MTSPKKTTPKRLPEYELRRVGSLKLAERPWVGHEGAAREVASKLLTGLDREHMIAIYLDARMHMIGVETVAIGTQHACSVEARTVFRGALLAGATAIVLVHNHPSGSPDFSADDWTTKSALEAAGKVIGIQVVDFLVHVDSEAA